MHTPLANLAGERLHALSVSHSKHLHLSVFWVYLCSEESRARTLSVSETNSLWPYTRYSRTLVFFLRRPINSCQIYIDRISGPQVVKTQGQQLLAKEEEILCVLACSLEQVQHVDASVYLRTTDSYSRTGRTSSRLLPMHRLLTLDCTDGRELTGTLDDYRDEEQVNCSPIYLTLVLQLIK